MSSVTMETIHEQNTPDYLQKQETKQMHTPGFLNNKQGTMEDVYTVVITVIYI